jgi:hypothetical protein
MQERLEVVYHQPDQIVPVQLIDESESLTPEDVQATLRLLSESYGDLFEQPRGGFARGVMRRHFNADSEERVTEHYDRMRLSLEEGSQYWVIPDPSPAYVAWRGLAKVSPSQATARQQEGLDTPNLFMPELRVAPNAERQGIEIMLMHAALEHGSYEHDKAFAIDTYESEVPMRAALERLGLVAVEGAKITPITVDGHELPQRRYSTKPDDNIAGLLGRLEHYSPWLRDASVIRA